jgi:hypothetical protein
MPPPCERLGPIGRAHNIRQSIPVYVDTNVMAGNTGGSSDTGEYQGLVYLRATAENPVAAQLMGIRPEVRIIE